MIGLWLIIAATAVLTAVIVARPLMGAARAAGPSLAPELALGRAQLAELEEQLSLGLIAPGEAGAARSEIERRMLRSADTHAVAEKRMARRGHWPWGSIAASSFAVVMASGAVALYIAIGTPQLPSMPLADRMVASAQSGEPEFAALIERLAARMEANPGDPRGWLLLARSYARLGRLPDAAAAYRRGIKAGADDAETWSAYGEALVAAAEGAVSAESRAAFEAAAAREPRDVRARYYLGLAAAQDGDLRRASEVWRGLLADAPTGASWRVGLEAQLRRVAAELGTTPEEEPESRGSQLPAVDETVTAGLDNAERARFIRSMVERLAARLASNPNDFEGWMWLGHAYRVLGENEAAVGALERAVALANGGDGATPDSVRLQQARQALDDLRSSRREP